LLTLLWFESYLIGRQQRVIIEGTSSEWINVKAEVPQGSVLGHLLFVIYRVYQKNRNLGISQDIDIVLKTKDFRRLGI
jgi:hypothetical protein